MSTLKGTGELLALGISHKTAPVALRERLAFTEDMAVEFAQQIAESPEVHEVVVISTCNRTEIYLVVGGVGGTRYKRRAMCSACWRAVPASAPRSWRKRSTRPATARPPVSCIA